jgi:hypothetical protein
MTNSIPNNPSLRRRAYALYLHRACSTRTCVQLCAGIGRELGYTVAARSCTGVTRGATRCCWAGREHFVSPSSFPQLIDIRLAGSPILLVAGPSVYVTVSLWGYPRCFNSTICHCRANKLALGMPWEDQPRLRTSGPLAKPRPRAKLFRGSAPGFSNRGGVGEIRRRPHTSTCPLPSRRRAENPIGVEALAVGDLEAVLCVRGGLVCAFFGRGGVLGASACQNAPADSPGGFAGAMP